MSSKYNNEVVTWNVRLLETVADISYLAGYNNHYSGNSRYDISEYISWAKEFEEIHKMTVWGEDGADDYMDTVERFANEKIQLAISNQSKFD